MVSACKCRVFFWLTVWCGGVWHNRVLDENPELALMGSCVLVMIMKDEDVYILNVGDSRAIIAQDGRRGSFNSLSKLARNQLNGYKAPVDEHERIGARDSLLRQELERIIEETPTEIEALEAHDPTLGPPPPGLSLLGALQLTSDHSTSTEEVRPSFLSPLLGWVGYLLVGWLQLPFFPLNMTLTHGGFFSWGVAMEF
jgi:hypothetical protein